MSLYNLLHGVNPLREVLLSWLDIGQPDGKYESGRFRDIYLNEDGTKIILYTRNGGGNREEYQYIFDDFEENHPNYVRDWDDDFDCTYAYIEFTVPKEFEKVARAMATGEKPKTIHEKFEATMKEMEGMTPEQLKTDPRFASTIAMLEDISNKMDAQL
jgi:hypothetical protein